MYKVKIITDTIILTFKNISKSCQEFKIFFFCQIAHFSAGQIMTRNFKKEFVDLGGT
jgi:hypothetical protein